jgi:hypothetical protein
MEALKWVLNQYLMNKIFIIDEIGEVYYGKL